MTEAEATSEWPCMPLPFDLGNLNEFPHSGASAQQNTLSTLFRKRSVIPPTPVL